MKHSTRSSFLIIILIVSLIIPVLSTTSNVDGAPTRGAEEDLRMSVSVEFDGITSYLLDVDLNIFKMSFGNVTHNSTVLRELYQIQPDDTMLMIEDEVEKRVENITSKSFSGDLLEITSRELDLSTLDGNLTDTDPILFQVEISGEMNLSRYLDQDTLDRLEEGREDVFIGAMLMSGFEFTRSNTLRANPGQIVTYHFPSSWDPFGDGVIDILLRENGVDPVGGEYIKELDSTQGEFIDHFTFTLSATPRFVYHEEVISGDLVLDWYQLDRLDINGEVQIGPLGSDRSDILGDLPPSMSTPDAIPPGFIRFARGEGMLIDDDISEIQEQISQEIEDSLTNTMGSGDVEINSTLQFPPYTGPSNGEELENMIGSTDPNIVDVETLAPLELDILEDYQLNDVLGLLNGGLKIRKELDQITDDRMTVNITLPENLIFMEETPTSTSESRTTYPYSGGYKMLGSSLAPEYTDEKVVLNAVIDLSSVNSHYISDMEIEVGMDATISVHRIEYDPTDYEVNTDLEYELDYLTSDLIRLLDKMGMVNRSEIEEKVRSEVMDLIDDLMEEEGREVSVTLTDSSMIFDDNHTSMDDEEPIKIIVTASGNTQPLGSATGEEERMDKMNRFLPPHLDPIIPARMITKTIDTSGIGQWDTDLKVIFPSGFGISAWLGSGSNDKVTELDVIVEDGYPTLVLSPEDGEGDHITLELTVGPYFAFNNVTACFCSATGVVGILLLMMVLFIIKGIVKRKKEKGEAGEPSEDGEQDPDEPPVTTTKDENGNEVLNW